MQLGQVCPNIGTMLSTNGELFASRSAFAEKRGGHYLHTSWAELLRDVWTFGAFLSQSGLTKGSRVALVTENSYHRLVAELAVMSCGLVSVPIFDGYDGERLGSLIAFSEVEMLVVESPELLAKIPKFASSPHLVLSGSSAGSDLPSVGEILRNEEYIALQHRAIALSMSVMSGDLALVMYTSGTTGFPKGVMLTHHNILSQQRALELLWKAESGMRFLCYLPWHHSFGGLFERFFALYSGGSLAIDDSRGKNIDLLFQNFKAIRPHIYFSVPKVYAEIVSRILRDDTAGETFFHPDLRFVFTAAAPLSTSITDIFRQRRVPVAEGWGLTETSPCATLTELALDREPGRVGLPIPGVEVKLADDGEILVRGANVMRGYFKNPEATEKAFAADGWLKTGDIGGIDEKGVRILSRKDRMFKLDNAEKVFPAMIEGRIQTVCRFVKHAFVFGSGQSRPFALIFPNRELLEADWISAIEQDRVCENPASPGQLARCLSDCIHAMNRNQGFPYERVERALVINRELSLENNELTPSFKLVPQSVHDNFKTYIDCMCSGRPDLLPSDAYVVELNRAGSSETGHLV